jgi:hypothetical protein
MRIVNLSHFRVVNTGRRTRSILDAGKKLRWRWPYRLRPGLQWWIAEPLRIAIFMTPIVLAHYAWKHFQ